MKPKRTLAVLTLSAILLSAVPLGIHVARTFPGSSPKTESPSEEEILDPEYVKRFYDVQARPFWRYETTDIANEPKANSVYAYNFANMNLGGTSAASSSVWYDYRGETAGAESKPITVAVIDTGIDIYHADFLRPEAKNVTLTEANIADYSLIDPASCYIHEDGATYSDIHREDGILAAYDVDTLDEGETDRYSHGTASAACIGAAVNGMGGWGIAPKVNLLIIRMNFYLTAVDAAIRYAVDHGAAIINLSLGAYEDAFTDGYGEVHEYQAGVSTALVSSAQYAIDHDVVIVAAAGNEATDHYSYPACNRGVDRKSVV